MPMTYDFPADFLWGVATASYQIEGAHDDRPPRGRIGRGRRLRSRRGAASSELRATGLACRALDGSGSVLRGRVAATQRIPVS